jgi:predicted AAA+ superfamily ATPase
MTLTTFMKRKMEATIERWLDEDSSHPLLIRGVRRCGKTTTIEKVGRERFGEGFVKLDFQTELESIERIFDGPTDNADRIVATLSDYKRIPITRERCLLFFDEVQLSERALNSLRFFADSGWRVIASGSLLGVTSNRRTLPFPSGVRQVEMHPMDFEEWLWAMGETPMADAIHAHFESMEPYVAHEEALLLYHRYLVLGGMPKVVSRYLETKDLEQARVEQAEIDATYTADITNPTFNMSGVSAKRIWDSLPKQLLRSSTKKFKYADVIRGGRRQRLLEPLEWLNASGVVTICDMTQSTEMPLSPFDQEEGSFFKVYAADTGILFYKFGLDPQFFLNVVDAGETLASSDFRGALAENFVAQMLSARDLISYYWTPPSSWGATGELDFLLQTTHAEIVPIEVKSARNVRAKTLASFVRHAGVSYSYRLSEKQFGRETMPDENTELRSVPLYAAFCLGDGCVRR